MTKTRCAGAFFALALGAPLVARAADTPMMPGQAIGRSELPPLVDDSLARESRAAGTQIGRLRLQTRGGNDVYSADLVGQRNQVLTLDAKGHVLSRQLY